MSNSDVYLIPDQGWGLKKDIEKKCFRCFKPIEPPFYYCLEKGFPYCKDCDRKEQSRNHCNSKQNEHIHYNIISLSKQSSIALFLMLAGIWENYR